MVDNWIDYVITKVLLSDGSSFSTHSLYNTISLPLTKVSTLGWIKSLNQYSISLPN